jgi:DNA-binding response OmpR family regulator
VQILLVEDDYGLAKGLQQALSDEGFIINQVGSGEAALHVVATEMPDIMILDIGLPDIDGLTVLKTLRKKSELPVLLLTARDSLEDKVAGLDAGADDYLAKPFEMPELLARLRVLERRLSTSKSNLISIGEICLDAQANMVLENGEAMNLSKREFMLLKALMEAAGKILTREALEARLYSWGDEISSNAIEVHISNLRKKLPKDFIKTVRGIGYTVKKST